MARKLNQVIALEKEAKDKALSESTKVYQTFQKNGLFEGFTRTYRKVDDAGEDMPSESQRVQEKVNDLLEQLKTAFTEVFDITATKDFANTTARADVVLNGEVLIKDAPVPFLLYLEKQLDYLETAFAKLPTLSPTENWTFDTNKGLFTSETVSTHRSKKIPKAIVLYPHSPEHPAQTQLVNDDVLVGYWDKTSQSGAIDEPTKKRLLNNVREVSKAVKVAREEANNTPAPDVKVGEALFKFILS